MKEVLFIAYHYPPIASGTARVKGFVQHLPELGYRPHILTTATYGQTSDPRVYRARELLGLYRFLFHRKQRGAIPIQRSFERTQMRGIRNLARQCKRFLFIPDGQIGWLPHALGMGLRLIRRHRIEVLYSTAPPFSAHLLGLMLKRLTGIPWVADFRDTWTYDPLDEALLALPTRLQIERWLECAVLHRANRAIAVTDVAFEDFAHRYPALRDRLLFIPNGFNPEDVPEPISCPAERARLRLVYTGSFSHSHVARSPKPFFEGVKRFAKRCPHEARKLEIVIVGALSPSERRCAAELAQVVKLVGPVSRQTAIGWQQRADVLLLSDHVHAVPASNIPGKCYEYLAAQKPIFALVPEGATRRLIEKLRAGICVFPDDVNAIERGLKKLLMARQNGALDTWRVSRAQLKCFHARTTAAQLTRCFDRITSDCPSRLPP